MSRRTLAAAAVGIGIAAASSCVRDFVVEPPQFGTLKGRVLAAGEPRGGAVVRLERTTVATVSKADGTWTLRRVPLGRYDLFAGVDADSDGVFERSRRVPGVELLTGGEDLVVADIDMEPGGSLAGRVTSNAEPRPGAMVFLPGSTRLAFADAEGKYLLAGVAPGPRQVGAAAPGYVPVLAAVDLAPGEARDGVDFDLGAAAATGGPDPLDGAAFTGTVRWIDQPAVPGWAQVQAFEGAALRADAESAAGAFRLGPLAPGVYELRFDAPEHRTLSLPLMPLTAADFTVGEVWLEPGTPDAPGPGPDPADPDGGTALALTSPRALVASAGDGRVTLSWEAPESGADAYLVHRSDPANPTPAALNASAPTFDRAYVDTTVTNYQRYFYRVTAVLRGHESPIEDAPAASAIPGPGTVLSGPAGTRTLAASGNPHVVVGSDLIVLAGETLTLEPGVEVRFAAGLHLLVQGTLVARGSDAAPVTFTRFTSAGWAGLVFEDTSVDAVLDASHAYVSGSILERAIVEHATDTGVTVLSSSPLLLSVEVRYNSDYKDANSSFGGGLHIGPGAAPMLRACNIHHNYVGVVENDTTSSQWGAGVYSEGDPILWENEIALNGLRATDAGNSTSWGGGVFLRSGQATLSRNRIAASNAAGSSQANTGQVLRTRGLGLAVDGGAHLIANNVVENHSESHNPGDNRGAVWFRAGAHLFVRNRVAGNQLGVSSRGAAVAVEEATVRGFLNVFENNALTGTVGAAFGGALYAEDTQSVFRFNDFVNNSPVVYEVYNTGGTVLDLRDNYFAGTTPVDQRVYRAGFADFSGARTAPNGGAGPQPCLADAECAALGGAQRCWFGGCVPVCLVSGCAGAQSCDPVSGACGP